MARPITLLAIAFLSLNLFAGMITSTGLAADLGISTAVGAGDEVDQAVERANGTVDTGAPTGSTLFGMYNVLGSGLNAITAPVTAGPSMLSNIGVPGAITGMLQSLILVIYALGVISFMRGWGL